MYFRSYLEELADPKRPIVYSRLSNLSSLAGEDLQLFEQEWNRIESDRRREVVHRLAAMAEDNPEFDFDEIFRICLRDPDAEVRVLAVESVWESKDRTLIAPLIDLLRADPEESVRAAAALALGRFMLMAELNELRPRDAQRVEAALVETIENPTEPVAVRRRAVEAISVSSQPYVADIIEQAYRSADQRMRVSALFAMGHNCDARWLPHVMAELQSEDEEMRFEAAGAAGEIGDSRAVPALVRLIEDDDPQIPLAAIDALGRIGGLLAKQALQRCLKHPSEAICQAAEEALEEMHFSEDPLSFGLAD